MRCPELPSEHQALDAGFTYVYLGTLLALRSAIPSVLQMRKWVHTAVQGVEDISNLIILTHSLVGVGAPCLCLAKTLLHQPDVQRLTCREYFSTNGAQCLAFLFPVTALRIEKTESLRGRMTEPRVQLSGRAGL